MLPWLLAPLFGAFYGVAELIPRYQDAPGRALRTWSAAIYIAINAVASLAALALFRTLDFKLGLPAGSRRDVGQVLLAGFAAMAVFRSAFFIARVGDENVLVGPLTVVQAGLDASDRGVDRHRALSRSDDVVDAMEGVSFRQAFVDLPQLAFNLMQNVGELKKKRLADAATQMEASDFDDKTKVYVLG